MTHSLMFAAAAEASAKMKRVERVANQLAKLMQDIHGDDWKVSISHEYQTEMVVIIPRPGSRRQKPLAPKQEAGR